MTKAERAITATARQPSPTKSQLTILFVMRSPHLVRYYESSLRLLAARGHMIHLAFPRRPKGGDDYAEWRRAYTPLPPGATAGASAPDPSGIDLLSILATDHAEISWGFLEQTRTDHWHELAKVVRLCHDFTRFSDDAYAAAPALRDRALQYGVPAFFRSLVASPVLRPAFIRRGLRRFLAACDRALPVSRAAIGEILDIAPDVILVSRQVDFASIQDDYVHAAHALGIPVGLPVASWDNLTNKGLIRVFPDFVAVWNRHQKTEAIDLHRYPAGQVEVTGAQAFDHWFGREPSVDRNAFCQRLGLDPKKRIIVYLASTQSIAGREVASMSRWLGALRGQRDANLREANVVVRPHPYHADQWAEADFSGFGRTVVWPSVGTIPITEDQRDAFYDTLFHADAIVGLNTSALVEAAIVGTPVFILVTDADPAREGTVGTIHFRYLVDREGGVATLSENAEDHFDRLGEALAEPRKIHRETFLREFLRPNGVDRPAAPFLADAIENGARNVAKRPRRTGPLRLALRGALRMFEAPLVSSHRRALELAREAKARDRAGRRPAVQQPAPSPKGSAMRLGQDTVGGAATLIPKLIHQIWVGPSPVPEEYLALVEKLKAMHPGWEHRLWTEDDLGEETFRDEWRDRLRVPAERSDLLRLEVLYKYGGVYLDIDFDFCRPMDALMSLSPLVVADLKPGRINNAFIAVVPGHPLIRQMIDEARPVKLLGLDKEGTGPLLVDRILEPHKGTPEVTVLPVESFYPELATEETFAIHLQGRSWKDDLGWKDLLHKSTRRARAAQKYIAVHERALSGALRSREQLQQAEARVRKLEGSIEEAIRDAEAATRRAALSEKRIGVANEKLGKLREQVKANAGMSAN